MSFYFELMNKEVIIRIVFPLIHTQFCYKSLIRVLTIDASIDVLAKFEEVIRMSILIHVNTCKSTQLNPCESSRNPSYIPTNFKDIEHS